MRVKVRAFGGMRDYVADDVQLDLHPGATVAEVAAFLVKNHPDCAPLLASCSYVIDNIFVEKETAVREGAVLEVMPPFSGG